MMKLRKDQQFIFRVFPQTIETTPMVKESNDTPNLTRKHICHVCYKRFNRSEHLKRHVRTHTGEKPYQCSFPNCLRNFSRSDELTRHTRVHEKKRDRVSSVAEVECISSPLPYPQSHAPKTALTSCKSCKTSDSLTGSVSTGKHVALEGQHNTTVDSDFSGPTTPELKCYDPVQQHPLCLSRPFMRMPIVPFFTVSSCQKSRSLMDIHSILNH